MTTHRTRTPTKAYLAYMEELKKKDEEESSRDIFSFD